MPRTVSVVLGATIAILMIGGPWCYVVFKERQIRHFRLVRDEVLYRSGQMSLDGLKRVVHEHGIRTVVTLRDADDKNPLPPDAEEEAYCRERGLNHVRIPPRLWSESDGTIPADRGVKQFLAVMDNPANYPVLIHCFAGIHRTGSYCAIYRIEYEGWSNAAAIAEMRRCGYRNLDVETDVLGYVENYRPRKDRAARNTPARN